MSTSHLSRGRIRASWFDVTIAARRLEEVSRSFEDMQPAVRLSLQKEAAILRERAASIMQLLTKPEQQRLADQLEAMK